MADDRARGPGGGGANGPGARIGGPGAAGAPAPPGGDLGEAEARAVAALARELTRAGRADDARALWEGLAVLRPGDAAPWRGLALLAALAGRWPEAASLAGAALARAPGAAAAHLLRAEALLALGRGPEARADLAVVAALETPPGTGERALRDWARGLLASAHGW